MRITYKNSSLGSSTTRRKPSKAKEAAYRGIDESRSHCLSPFVAIYPASRLIETVIKRVKSDRGSRRIVHSAIRRLCPVSTFQIPKSSVGIIRGRGRDGHVAGWPSATLIPRGRKGEFPQG